MAQNGWLPCHGAMDASAAELCYGKTLDLPGSFLTHPGEPLSNLQTKALLEELYKMNARPALQTSATVEPLDIAFTNSASHVYVKKENPLGLSSKFEGPYKIISRPSRSTIEVRIGSFVDGRPRLQVFNWQQCYQLCFFFFFQWQNQKIADYNYVSYVFAMFNKSIQFI